jgi:ERCC4-related helicase
MRKSTQIDELGTAYKYLGIHICILIMATTRRRPADNSDTQPTLFEIRTAEQMIREAKPSGDAQWSAKPAVVAQANSSGQRMVGNVVYLDARKSPIIDEIMQPLLIASRHNFPRLRRKGLVGHDSLESLTAEELAKIREATDLMPKSAEKFNLIYDYWHLRYLKELYDQLTTEGIATFLKNEHYKGQVIKYTTFISLYSDGSFNSASMRAKKSHSMGLEHPKMDCLVDLMKHEGTGKTVIFVKYEFTAHAIHERLAREGINSAVLETYAQAKLSKFTRQQRRQKAQDFKDGKLGALITTSLGDLGKGDYKLDLAVLYGHTDHATIAVHNLIESGKLQDSSVRILVAQGTREEGSVRQEKFAIKHGMETFLRREWEPEKIEPKKPKQNHINFEGLSNTDIKKL